MSIWNKNYTYIQLNEDIELVSWFCLFLVAVRDKICSSCTIILKAKTIKSPLFDLVTGYWEWKSCQCQKFFILICILNSNNLSSINQNNIMLCLCMILVYIIRDLIFKTHAFLSLSFQMAYNMYVPRTYFFFFFVCCCYKITYFLIVYLGFFCLWRWLFVFLYLVLLLVYWCCVKFNSKERENKKVW